MTQKSFLRKSSIWSKFCIWPTFSGLLAILFNSLYWIPLPIPNAKTFAFIDFQNHLLYDVSTHDVMITTSVWKQAWILKCSCFTGGPWRLCWCTVCEDHNEFICSWSTTLQIILTNSSKSFVRTCSTSFEWFTFEFGSNVFRIWAIWAIGFSGFKIEVIRGHKISL